VYKSILKPLFFTFSPEKAHYLAIDLFKFGLAFPGGKGLMHKLYDFQDKALEKNLFGLTFKNPVGLAAGFDKDGKFYRPMANLGFGFIEIGTVTPLPQPGNPQPRLFRLPKDQALINRMGFNNDGVDAMVSRLQKTKLKNTILGGNIGKNKITPNEKAVDDYLICFEKLFPYVDYFVVNVSSPNTPGLRELQDKKPLTHILSSLQEINDKKNNRKPILLKIAPDLTNDQLDDIVAIVKGTGIDGLIATNTTIDRSALVTPQSQIEEIGNGGLSGFPLKARSTEVIQYLHEKSNGKIPIIGVGGIHNREDALEKLKAGAALIQLYTGFIYEGPGVIKSINKYLLDNLDDWQ
jgi:dihydroorotate dehydrogenase